MRISTETPRRAARGLALLALLALAPPAPAHQFRSAYLQLSELPAAGHYQAELRLPWLPGGRLPPLQIQWPADCAERPESAATQPGELYLRRRSVWRCAQPLHGRPLAAQGLGLLVPELIVELNFAATAAGTGSQRLLTLGAGATGFRFAPEAAANPVPAWPAYLGLGVEHILFGLDHLLFVTGLLLLVLRRPERRLARLLMTVTAFTLAHSLTLGAAALGALRLPGAPVEACIAASILLLAVELARPPSPRPALSLERPWLPAFAFGLLHGFGFAGALADIGLPEAARLPALALFNIGVELGQLLFLAALTAAALLLYRLHRPALWRARLALVPLLGTVAAAWLIERTLAVLA